ncbi:LuxR C-terminal-related transcriptional regulator [Palleronia pelagia]|uniref:DNA-binding response regulator, NarL/FixJ family, contains REC and HTH domains n=1 Tax=Palleronia pelagia TaxID=387096 RepID=A0A1H8GJM5_9RHOB|nr:response regulator transcription factor [Palleronia pelagia]SEN43687.1 DNA-binding response regulator, NarL/FixJ family, contains REC and HTH domains [Palleronia pelagia]
MTDFSNAPDLPRVLFIDDSAILSRAVERELNKGGDLAVIGRCDGQPSIVTGGQSACPGFDVVVFDPEQSGSDPAVALDVMREAFGPAAIVAYVSETSEDVARRCLGAQYDGVVSRAGDIEMLGDALLCVSAGGLYVDGCFAELGEAHPADGPQADEDLTEREREVLKAVVGGRSCRAIGRDLSISGKTVETHKYRAMSKLGLTGARDLELFARDNAWAA